MKEEFLHFIWKNRLYDPSCLVTTEGEKLTVIDPGSYNTDSGPDFFNSRITIGDTSWAGNVELHTRSSHWRQHGHHDDHSYDNVILHVVSENDEKVFTAAGESPETMVMVWDESIYGLYEAFLGKPYTIACRDYLEFIDPFYIRLVIYRIAVSRLEAKTTFIGPILESSVNDWEETLYRLMSRYFGMNVNSEPFYRLASSLPLRILRKHRDNPLQVESLMYGQAGLLNPGLFPGAISDTYYRMLSDEFRVLRAKYSLSPIEGWTWKFSRMRPANFPTIRISQLAHLLCNSDPLFSQVREAKSVDRLRTLLHSQASDYWDDHYIFGKKAGSCRKQVGRSMTDLLIINTVIPLIFLYGRQNGRQQFCDRAIDLFDSMPPEDNSITREWSAHGVVPASALESQGLIGLQREQCKFRRCLNCDIGTKLISLGKEIDTGKNPSLEEPS